MTAKLGYPASAPSVGRLDMQTSFDNLRELRESLLGYAFAFVARHAEIASERLAAIEAGDLPSLDELERLARLYGLDADTLEEEPITLAAGDSIGALASLDEFREVGDLARSRIVSAARAARDLMQLEQALELPSRLQQFVRDAPPLRRPRASPHREGARLAGELRRRIGLGAEPITSMRDFVHDHFPAVAVLHADLTSRGPAGLAFADSHRGPTIILNTCGKNENPTVRRFSLAHELCHLLVDWNRRESIAQISGYLHDSSLDIERRANAFAIRLLCPESVVHGLDEGAPHDEQASIIAAYGLPYSAIRLYLKNEAGRELPRQPDPAIQRLTVDQKWTNAEDEQGLDKFPLAAVPFERRTLVARAAASLYSKGELPRDAFAEALDVSAGQELERVLDFFELDWPSSSHDAA
jgi:Zn-dependent peptidase ImmA (M78 family)